MFMKCALNSTGFHCFCVGHAGPSWSVIPPNSRCCWCGKDYNTCVREAHGPYRGSNIIATGTAGGTGTGNYNITVTGGANPWVTWNNKPENVSCNVGCCRDTTKPEPPENIDITTKTTKKKKK